MIVTFATSSHLEKLKTFLKSIKNNTNKVLINSLNMRKSEINELNELYPNLEINNEKISIEELASRYNCNLEKLISSKEYYDTKKLKSKQQLWKNIISLEKFNMLKSINIDFPLIYCDCDFQGNIIEDFLYFDEDVQIFDNIKPRSTDFENINFNLKTTYKKILTNCIIFKTEKSSIFILDLIKNINQYNPEDNIDIGKHALFYTIKNYIENDKCTFIRG